MEAPRREPCQHDHGYPRENVYERRRRAANRAPTPGEPASEKTTQEVKHQDLMVQAL